MRLTHWLAGLARKQPLSRRSIRRKWRGDVACAAERLEDRTLLAAPHPFYLSTLDGSNGFRLDGIDYADISGHSVSTAGDVNGDGYADILVGAYGAHVGDAGETYVVFGSGDGFSASLDLSTLDGSNGFRLDGIDSYDSSGHSVSTAGDVNGDGYADILVGAVGADPGGDSTAGETYVVFGSGSGFAASLDLDTLDGSNGFRLDGIDALDSSGRRVSTAGDVNGDGYDDILVGARRADPGGDSEAGETYVVFGSGGEFAASLDLYMLDGSNGFRLDGIDAGDWSGYSVSTAGDVNGDGYADILVGAPYAHAGGDIDAGETYVVFGSGSGFAASLDLSTLDGSNGFRLDGIDEFDYSGYSVSTAGDVNGDGYADILVGAKGTDSGGGSYAGKTYVVFGSGFADSLDLDTLDGSNGFRLNGIDLDDDFGFSVSTAGDVNGDGYDDILVGAKGADPGGDEKAGETYVVFGSGGGFAASLDLSTLDGSNGFRLDGINAEDHSGTSVSTAGDVNGDGYADILIGAPHADQRGPSTGETYVVFGGDFTESVTHAGTSADDTLTGDATANVIVAGQGDDTLVGNGGADVLYAAEGDDVLLISDTRFRRVDGGPGVDTLVLDAIALTLDLSTIPDNRLRGIERIDLTASGAQEVVISPLEVLNLSDTSNSVTIIGYVDDVVPIDPAWTFSGVVQPDGSTVFNRYILGAAELLVESNIPRFSVNTTADTMDANPGDGIAADTDGNTSLRAAVMEANALAGDDTIYLPAGTYTRTMGGLNEGHATTGDLDIRDDLIITGAGATDTIIDAASLDRVFHVFGDSSLTIIGVTMTGGLALGGSNGGGILNGNGLLTIQESTLIANTSTADGGAIYSDGSLTLQNTTVSGNTASGAKAIVLVMLEDQETLAIDSSLVETNYGTGVMVSSVSQSGDMTVLVHNSTFHANTSNGLDLAVGYGSSSISIGESSFYGNGHIGIRVEQMEDASSVRIFDSVVDSNTHGIFIDELRDDAVLTLETTTIAWNTGSECTHDEPLDLGTGVYLQSAAYGSQVNLSTLTIVGNDVGINVGNSMDGTFSLSDSVVLHSCGLGVRFGDIGGTVSVTGNTIANNEGRGLLSTGIGSEVSFLVSNNTITGNTGSGDGGGIYLGNIGSNADVHFVNNTITGNTVSGDGGGIYLGNIYSNADVQFVNNTVFDNTAGVNVGGLFSGGSYPVTVANNIIAGNHSATGDADIRGTYTSGGNNLIGIIGEAEGIENGVNGDIAGLSTSPVDPLIGPLRNDGHPTPTHPLLPGSPAIDAGNNDVAPATDQHGVDRPQDGDSDGTATVDIGAVELHLPSIRGMKFHDVNGDGIHDLDEPGLSGWTIYIDANNNEALDGGELSTITLADDPYTNDVDEIGTYFFEGIESGTHVLREESQSGWEQIAPVSYNLTVGAGDSFTDINFANRFLVSQPAVLGAGPGADDGAADTFLVIRSGDLIEVSVNSSLFIRKPLAEVSGLMINGSDDDDTLIVDFSNGSPVPSGGISFAGMGETTGGDTLVLQGGASDIVQHDFTNSSDGSVTVDGSVISYSGLEPISDNLTVTDRIFTFGAADDVVTLANKLPQQDEFVYDGLMILSSVSSSETVIFSTPTSSLSIKLGDGADQLTVDLMDYGFMGTSLTLNGESGDDRIEALAVDVRFKINGSAGNDTLTGSQGDDTLNGGSGADQLVGGRGNDKLHGQGGSLDTLSGGPGDDTLDGGDGYDHISESANVSFSVTNSTLTGLGNDTLINIQLAQLFGGSSDNTIDASAFSGRAFLNGLGGDDTLTGGAGYDRLFGGAGRDLIVGGDKDDVLRGQGGNYDTLIGGAGNDKLNGGAGHDILIGGGGDDVLTGESGDDTLDGGAGTDRLYERANVDMTLTDASLSGGLGSDDLTSIETAYLKGGNSNNRLDASAFSGDVTLIGVGGADTLRGGSGNDMLNGRSGNDSITGGDGDDTLKGLRDNDTLNGGSGNDWLDGGTQDDSISGWTGDDVLYGRSGNDILVGGDGHDSLYGASGDDLLQGDDGKTDTDHTRDDDRLDGGSDGDTIRGGGGSDTMLDDESEVDENFTYWAEWVDAV